MSCTELQEEELEVLRSIYEGDDNFKEISSSTFQYKYGEDGSFKSFMVEIEWSDTYPEEAPGVNMNVFYNKNIYIKRLIYIQKKAKRSDTVKQKVADGILQQTEDFLGCAMTYTLFEWVKENYEDLVSEQQETQVVQKVDKTIEDDDDDKDEPSKKKEKKEQLTKNQKRRMFDKFGNAAGDKPRGWDWVDIVKHLSQTGGQKS